MRRLLAIIILLGFGGCGASHQSVVADVSAEGWHTPTAIVMANSDTTTLRDLDIFIRHSVETTPSQIEFRVESIAPDSTSFTDEVVLKLDTRAEGHKPNILSVRPYRSRVVWRQVGNYQILFTPTTNVVGVEAIGINIKKSEI